MSEQTAGRFLAEVTLDNGEIVFVNPLSPYALQAIIERSKELCPDPDAKLYERPLKGAPEGAPPEPLEMNPEWVKAQAVARKKQNDYIHWSLAQSAIVNTPEGKDATVARFADTIAALRKVAKIVDGEWEATVLYALITTWADVNRIYAAVTQNLPTSAGVSDKIKFFRTENRWG